MDVLEVALSNLFEEFVLIFGSEWVISLQDNKQKDAETPQVGVYGNVITFGDDLRCHVCGCSTEGVDSTGRNGLEAETKVDKFQLFVSVQEYVLCFDISVHYVSFVKVFQGFSNDLEKLLGLCLLQTMLPFRKQIVIQRVGTTIFLNEVYFSAALYDIYEFGDDRMAEFGKYIDFALQIFELIGLIQSFLFVYLDGYFLVGTFADAHLDDTISTFAQLLVNLIILQLLLPLDLEIYIQELLFGCCGFWFLFLLHLLIFEFVHVIWGKLLLHEMVDQILILLFGPFFLFFKRFLTSFRV